MKITDLKENQVVHCQTEEEAKRILKLAHEEGYKWNGGETLVEDALWRRYSSSTCYKIGYKSMVGNLEFYTSADREIIPSDKITKESKDIIGYKFKDNKYYKAASMIVFGNESGALEWRIEGRIASTHSIDKLKEAGVLDLWFEPVYKDEKKVLEVGKWYKPKDGRSKLVYKNEEKGGYGFIDDKWRESLYCQEPKSWRPATTEEVEEALIEEAKKRGFEPGVKFKPLNKHMIIGNPETVEFVDFMDFDSAGLWVNGKGNPNGIIFKDGRWAKLIKNELPIINGYKGSLTESNILKYGCANLLADWFKESENRRITSITLDSGVTINEDQINQIKNYLG